MASGFAALKERKAASDFSHLTKEIEKLKDANINKSGDDRFWKLTVDEAGNGSAVIRFLPELDKEDVPWIRMWDHGFKGPSGQWYIENSLTSIEKKDPVSEYNSRLWNTDIPANQDIARNQKRRLCHVSNIYVVSDKSNPDNEGKVFLFRYGQRIFDKLNDAMNPEFEDETAFNPFDFWVGANFKLRARVVKKYRSYDKSEFADCGPLFDDDAALERIYGEEYSLQQFLDPSNFKTYVELATRLKIVLGGDDDEDGDAHEEAPASAPVEVKERSLPTAEQDHGSKEDSDLDFFEGLADD